MEEHGLLPFAKSADIFPSPRAFSVNGKLCNILLVRLQRQTPSMEIVTRRNQDSNTCSLKSSHPMNTTTSSIWEMRSWTARWKRLPKKRSQQELFQRKHPFKRSGRRVQVRRECLVQPKKTTMLKLTMESAKKWRVFWRECLKGTFLGFCRLITCFV